jgi:hypothetical protein
MRYFGGNFPAGRNPVAQAKTTAQKKNAYKIRTAVDRAIFTEFQIARESNDWRGTVISSFDIPLISALANIATRAVMQTPRLNVVLKKG